MTIRIVDDKPDESVVKRIVCRECGVKLEYLPIDVRRYEGKDYSGGPDGAEWIDCPQCNNEVVLKRW